MDDSPEPRNNSIENTLHAAHTFSLTDANDSRELQPSEVQQPQMSQTPNDPMDMEESSKKNEPPNEDAPNYDPVLEQEKERIQRETSLRLQQYLETEGKAYPTPRAQASHPIFANDGSFLETFKTLQGQMQQQQVVYQLVQPKPVEVEPIEAPMPSKELKPVPPTIKRRGGKILKTGVVRKQRVVEEADETDAQPKDSWNAYLKEVKRYKSVTCSEENMTRSLVK